MDATLPTTLSNPPEKHVPETEASVAPEIPMSNNADVPHQEEYLAIFVW